MSGPKERNEDIGCITSHAQSTADMNGISAERSDVVHAPWNESLQRSESAPARVQRPSPPSPLWFLSLYPKPTKVP